MKDFNAYITVNTKKIREKVTKSTVNINCNLKPKFVEMLMHVFTNTTIWVKYLIKKKQSTHNLSEYTLFKCLQSGSIIQALKNFK